MRGGGGGLTMTCNAGPNAKLELKSLLNIVEVPFKKLLNFNVCVV